ncbi:MAG: hypothetical protein QOJ29_3195, partial [Thermoleophilaceae bacterium]|nr:hypothetical protein [Thermoleophilaceae bacterium]
MSRFREYVPSVRAALRPGILGELHAARALGVGIPELRPAREAHLDLLPSLTSLDGGLVLDVGANVGDWTAALLRVVPGARVIAIEPGDEPRAEIERRFGRDARVTIDRRAVSSSAGTRDFHLTEATLNAS